MKKLLFFLTILLNIISGSHAQECNCPIINIDSALIQYGAINFKGPQENIEFIDIKLKIKHSELEIYKRESKPNYAPEIILICKTSNKDTIDRLFRWVAFTMDNPPFYDSNHDITDVFNHILITVYEDNQECTSVYPHRADAYFPLAYVELYGFIQQIYVKYMMKK